MTAVRATHACPGGCHRQVPSGHFACRWCWYRLPPALRDLITATHGRDPDAHVEAMLSALAWYREEPVERTAVPAAPPWPRVVEGQCSWCGDPEPAHEGGVREHHRIEMVGGRYDDEPEILRPGLLPAPVDPESPGVTDADLGEASAPPGARSDTAEC